MYMSLQFSCFERSTLPCAGRRLRCFVVEMGLNFMFAYWVHLVTQSYGILSKWAKPPLVRAALACATMKRQLKEFAIPFPLPLGHQGGM